MTHEFTGNYAAKHQNVPAPNPELSRLLLNAASDRRLSCAAAHKLARDQRMSPAAIGQALDQLEIRLTDCTLGLFGQGRKANKPAPEPASSFATSLINAIEAALEAGCLPCASAWAIAEDQKIPRKRVAVACESLGIKISPCQLGAF